MFLLIHHVKFLSVIVPTLLLLYLPIYILSSCCALLTPVLYLEYLTSYLRTRPHVVPYQHT